MRGRPPRVKDISGCVFYWNERIWRPTNGVDSWARTFFPHGRPFDTPTETAAGPCYLLQARMELLETPPWKINPLMKIRARGPGFSLENLLDCLQTADRADLTFPSLFVPWWSCPIVETLWTRNLRFIDGKSKRSVVSKSPERRYSMAHEAKYFQPLVKQRVSRGAKRVWGSLIEDSWHAVDPR